MSVDDVQALVDEMRAIQIEAELAAADEMKDWENGIKGHAEAVVLSSTGGCGLSLRAHFESNLPRSHLWIESTSCLLKCSVIDHSFMKCFSLDRTTSSFT